MRFDIHRLFDTASTNDDAKLAAEAGAAEGTVIWALRQSAGRGRRGRVWSSPEGNLYCSVLLRPSLAPKDYGHYSFIAALALYDTVSTILNPLPLRDGEGRVRGDLEIINSLVHPHPNPSPSQGGRGAVSPVCIELKWPNDVLVKGKKISGILLESGETSGQNWLIMGMGLNVRHFPENPLYPVTSLAAEATDTPPLDIILDQLLNALGSWIDRLHASGFAPIRTAWCAHARKGPMTVRMPDGEINGEFHDLDADGNLLLRLPDGTIQSIHTGDVFF